MTNNLFVHNLFPLACAIEYVALKKSATWRDLKRQHSMQTLILDMTQCVPVSESTS